MKFEGTFSCRHKGTVDIYGPSKNRQNQADYRFSGLCPSCYKKKLEEEREEKRIEANKKSEGFIELVGSEKQIAWATIIRHDMIKEIESVYNRINLADYSKSISYITSMVSSAKWFIDNKDLIIRTDLIKILVELHDREKPERVIQKDIEKELEEKYTIYPQEQKSKTAAVIEVDKNKVVAKCKRDQKFINLVKGLGYKWDGRCWYLKVGLMEVSTDDRAAELGNALLREGYPVTAPINDNVLKMMVEATYKKTIDYLIFRTTEGDYADCFKIVWRGKDDETYNMARKLPESKWINRGVIVKKEYYEEIEEFSQLLGFEISKGAKKLISEQKKKELEKTHIIVKEADIDESRKVNGLEQILKTGDGIIDDLKD